MCRVSESWTWYVKLKYFITLLWVTVCNFLFIFSASFAKRLGGLKPQNVTVNVQDNYQRYDINQESIDPYKVASDCYNEQI